jgi:hypothetical protein
MSAIEELPDAQRVVITMRDVAGCSPEEVCGTLDVSDGNQRVLLHRARSHVRSALERHWMAESHDHLSCQEVVELVTDYLDGALGGEETALFEQHLNFCDGCVWYVDQIKTTVETVGEVREEDVPPEAKDWLLTAFRNSRAP